MIYLDNAATTRVLPAVWQSMQPFYTKFYGNPDSPHKAGSVARNAVEKARVQVRDLLHTLNNGEVIFTSGGTEANNMAFQILNKIPLAMNIITSKTEHKSVLEPADASNASSVRILKPGKKGYISVDDIIQNSIPAFTLVSLMYMNNETGMLNDVYRIGEMLRKFRDQEVYFHVDCVQAAGSVPIEVLKMNADMVSVSSHKLHGPKGVGCLWVSDRVLKRMKDPEPLRIIRGGGQQNGFRAGTLDVPGIVGFGTAAKIAADTLRTCADDAYNELSGHFLSELGKHCADRNVKFRVNTFTEERHCNKVLSITFPSADAETVVLVASRNGLYISAGAACNSELSEPSYVLTSSGISPDLARNTVRVSFSPYDTLTDVEIGAQILAGAVAEVLSLNLTDAVS